MEYRSSQFVAECISPLDHNMMCN